MGTRWNRIGGADDECARVDLREAGVSIGSAELEQARSGFHQVAESRSAAATVRDDAGQDHASHIIAGRDGARGTLTGAVSVIR